MTILPSGAKWGEVGELVIAGVPSGAIEVPEWRWASGKAFRVGKGRYIWIARNRVKPWHQLVGNQWLTAEEIKAAGLTVAQADYYGETADGEIYGTASLYSNARASSDATDTSGSSARVGQQYDSSQYYCYRAFFSFDTSGIDDAHTVVSAAFYAKAYLDQSATDFQVQLYRYAWAEPLGTYQEANYDGAYGGSATLEGTFRNTADGWSSGTYYSKSVDAAGINKSGDSKYTLVSKQDVDNSAPTGNEYVFVYTADESGTSSDPYLAITTQVPGFAGMF